MAIRDEENTGADHVKNVHDEQHQRNAPGNNPDPSAKRNVGPGGDLERNDQKDKLENLHITGDSVTGMGRLDPNSKESDTQGPGFEMEGSYDAMDGSYNGIRMSDQPFGSKETEDEQNGDPGRI